MKAEMKTAKDDPLANAIYVHDGDVLVALSAPEHAPGRIDVQLVTPDGELDSVKSEFLVVRAVPVEWVLDYFVTRDEFAAAEQRLRREYDAYMEAAYPDDDEGEDAG